MKTLSKSKPFYEKALQHFRNQFKDVSELTYLTTTIDKKVCGGEWINSKGENCISQSVDAYDSIKIIP